VLQLGVQIEVDILDLDPVSTVEEVLAALKLDIPDEDNPVVKADRDTFGYVRI